MSYRLCYQLMLVDDPMYSSCLRNEDFIMVYQETGTSGRCIKVSHHQGTLTLVP